MIARINYLHIGGFTGYELCEYKSVIMEDKIRYIEVVRNFEIKEYKKQEEFEDDKTQRDLLWGNKEGQIDF